MADRNVNDPNDPQENAEDRPTWDLGGQVKRPEEHPDLIDPDPQDERAQRDQSDPTLSDAGVDTQALADDDLKIDEGAATFGSDDTADIVGEADDSERAEQPAEPAQSPSQPPAPEAAEPSAAPAEPDDDKTNEPVTEPDAAPDASGPVPAEPTAGPAQAPTVPAPIQDSADHTAIPHVAAGPQGDQEIPRDVLERRLDDEEDYERRRDIDLSKLNPEPEKPAVPQADLDDGADAEPTPDAAGTTPEATAPEATTADAAEDEIKIDYSKFQEDEPADAKVNHTREEVPHAAPADPALAAAGAGAGAAAAASDDDLESTKVRRQSLLTRDDSTDDNSKDSGNAEATTAWRPREAAPTEDEIDASIFDEATVVPEVPSRVGARIWSFILTLIGFPAGWYLITDAAARLTLAEGNAMATGNINPAALIELGAGAIVAIILVMLTIKSSLGAIIFGFLFMVAGGFFLAAPILTAEFMDPVYNWLIAFNDFGGNVAHHIQWTGYTGALLITGLMLFIIGLTSIFARRDGRREQEIKAQIERMAPGTLKKGRRKKKA